MRTYFYYKSQELEFSCIGELCIMNGLLTFHPELQKGEDINLFSKVPAFQVAHFQLERVKVEHIAAVCIAVSGFAKIGVDKSDMPIYQMTEWNFPLICKENERLKKELNVEISKAKKTKKRK